MRGAFGALGWTPDAFWTSTLTEYTLAIEGFNQTNGAGQKSEPDEDELEALVARYG